jgi:NAD(P)-dependent dehydrogenase (short-subunit alcohol dehydrogenase family)
MQLRGKVVAITGAAGGIGSALARRCAQEGAKLALLDLDLAGSQALADELAASGVEAMGLACDVTNEADCTRAFEAIAVRFGGVDVLVNNAGITSLSPFAETGMDAFRKVLDVNLMGSVYCTQAALPSLRARRGWIVANTSVAGFAPLQGRSAYVASKHAMQGLFDTLRAELAEDGVGVTILCPSYTDTKIVARALDGRGGTVGGDAKVADKMMTPDELAELVVRGLKAERRLILPTWTSWGAWWVSRLAPALYDWLMMRNQKSRQGAHGAWTERSSGSAPPPSAASEPKPRQASAVSSSL